MKGYRSFPRPPTTKDTGVATWSQQLVTTLDTEMFWLDDSVDKRIRVGVTSDRPESVGSSNLFYNTVNRSMYVDTATGWQQTSGGDTRVDGGNASSVYTADQVIDGGSA